MPNIVTGQSYGVVSCQSCETDLSFQKAVPSRRRHASADALRIVCKNCGHEGSYQTAQVRQSQAEYPL